MENNRMTLKEIALIIKEKKVLKVDEANYINETYKKFRVILHVLDIPLGYIKVNNEYSFCLKDAAFVEQLILNYSEAKCRKFRKEEFEQLPYYYLEMIIYSFLNIMRNNGLSRELLDKQEKIMLRKTKLKLLESKYRVKDAIVTIEEMTDYLAEKESYSLDYAEIGEEQCQVLDVLFYRLKKVILELR